METTEKNTLKRNFIIPANPPEYSAVIIGDNNFAYSYVRADTKKELEGKILQAIEEIQEDEHDWCGADGSNQIEEIPTFLLIYIVCGEAEMETKMRNPSRIVNKLCSSINKGSKYVKRHWNLRYVNILKKQINNKQNH